MVWEGMSIRPAASIIEYFLSSRAEGNPLDSKIRDLLKLAGAHTPTMRIGGAGELNTVSTNILVLKKEIK